MKSSAEWFRCATAATLVLILNHVAWAAQYTWQLPAGTSGNWAIPANWGGVVPTSNDDAYITGGTAVITTLGNTCGNLYVNGPATGGSTVKMPSGQLSVGSFEGGGVGSDFIGYSGGGSFIQSGGTVSVTQYFPIEGSYGINIGYLAGSVGSYTLSGNGALYLQGSDYGSSMNVGASGSGSFAQTGGTVSVFDYNGGGLAVAANPGSLGSYSLSAGLLSVTGQALPGNEQIGSGGSGIFTQSGGTNHCDGVIQVGSQGPGSYTMSGNSVLTASTINVGGSTSGSLAQSSGTTSASNLNLGVNSGGSGTYTLSGGVLTGPSENIGGGSTAQGFFLQSAGLNSAAGMSIAAGGVYQLYGGTLQVAGNFVNNGVLDGGNMPSTLSFTGSLVADFNPGVLQNAGSMKLSAGPFTLLNFPTGFNPSATFGSYNSAGVTHIVGSPLVIPANNGFVGSITLNDPVICQGTITPNGGSIFLTNGLTMSGAAGVSLGGGNLIVNDMNSGISGATSALTANSITVGSAGTGVFTQTNGNVSGILIVGDQSGSSGTYVLGNGQFASIGEVIGNSGSGSFVQMNGINAISSTEVSFFLGNNAGSFGSYTLGGTGQLTMQAVALGTAEIIGAAGTGVLTQTGGLNSTGQVVLGRDQGSSGTYNLNGGLLRTSTLTQGGGAYSFNFNGGVLQAADSFSTNMPITIDGPATFDSAGGSMTFAG